MWVELHTSSLDGAMSGLRALGLRTERVDLSEFGRAARIFRGDALCGAVVESTEAGAPRGWLPFRSVQRIEAASAVVPAVRLPGGARAIVLDEGQRFLGLWEGGPEGQLRVRAMPGRWALEVGQLPVGASWTEEDNVVVHRDGWAVVQR